MKYVLAVLVLVNLYLTYMLGTWTNVITAHSVLNFEYTKCVSTLERGQSTCSSNSEECAGYRKSREDYERIRTKAPRLPTWLGVVFKVE